MTDAPAPGFHPADLGLYPLRMGDRLATNEWAELRFHDLLGSRFLALCLHDDRRDIIGTALILWAECYRLDPAGTLPADDIELAQLARYGSDVSAWLQVKARVLHGWGLYLVEDAAEGTRRLGHPMIADIAYRSFSRKAGRTKAREEAALSLARHKVKTKLRAMGMSRMAEAAPLVDRMARWLMDAGLYITETNVREAAEVITGGPVVSIGKG